MTAGARLREAPATPLVLAGTVVLGVFAVHDGGFEVAAWAPGGAVLGLLLLVGLVGVPNAWRALPRSTKIAAAALAGYCAWSYLSVLWADDPGAAWLAANRTIVYLLAFTLFAAWRQRPATAGLALGLWVAVVTVLAAIVAVKLLVIADPRTLLPGGRLIEPTGYANATAALMMMAAVAALVCAAGRSVPWPLRALAGGAAVLCADVALLAVSRGSLVATPACLALLLIVLPDRMRRLATLLPVIAGVAIGAPSLIALTDLLGRYQPPQSLGEAHAAGSATILGALFAFAIVAAGALGEERGPLPGPAARTARRAGTALVTVGLLVAVVGGAVVVGNPATRLDNARDSFKGGYTEYEGSRLGSGLGSNRYDFYRVAVAEFRDNPVLGRGADNFFQAYLKDGRSEETPRFPHSLELRTLSETGIIGALLLFGAIAAALPAVVRAARQRGEGDAPRVIAAAALTAFAYWFVHGSADWFFEYAGLSTAAFALLGLACSLDPARRAVPLPTSPPARRKLVLAGVAIGLPVLALLAQWSSDREVTRAGAVFSTASGEAYDRLDRARNLDPFSARPDTIRGSIAVRLGDLEGGLAAFERALDRSPDDQYAQLEVGAIQSALGQAEPARRSLEKAARLAPRDPVTREALQVVRTGGTVDLAALSARVLASTPDAR